MYYSVSFFLLIAIFKFSQVFTIPPVACPDVYEYVQEGGGYFVRMTLSNLTVNTDVRITLAMEADDPDPEEFQGRLSTELDPDSVYRQLNKGEPIKYRVDFPIPSEPLKIEKIIANDTYRCLTTYPSTVKFIYLSHIIRSPPTNKDGKKMFEVIENHPIFVRSPSISPQQTTQKTTQQTTQKTTQQTTTIESSCGREKLTKSTAVTPLISGGTPIARGQFPWLAAIYRKFSKSIEFICGGSLISRRTVVSAAHCFAKLSFDNVVVYLGRYNLDDYSEIGHVSRGIKKLRMHPEFNRNMFKSDADIAILQLDTAVEYTQYILPICLWSKPDESINQIAGTTATVAGWGSQSNDDTLSSIPRMVDVNIASREECLIESTLFRVIGGKRSFCAGNGNDTGPCSGDSGGGLMIQRDGVWTLRGIVSTGETQRGRCDLLNYIIYCDVAKHMSWVEDNMV